MSKRALLVCFLTYLPTCCLALRIQLFTHSLTHLLTHPPTHTFLFSPTSAYFLNEEPFEWKTDGVALAFVMLGVLVCVVTAPKTNKSYTNAEFLALFRAPSFVTFIVLLLVFVVALWVAKQRILDEVEGDWGRLREREFTCRALT